MKRYASLFQLSRDAENVVAKHGIAGWLIMLCALLMSFLAIYTTTLSGIAGTLSARWEKTLNENATLRIPAEKIDENTNAIAENILSTTEGIISYALLTDEEQYALIAPWLGTDIPKEIIALPRIYTTVIDPEILDAEGVELRLESELPGALWDDHQRWRGPLLTSANRLKWVSWVSTAIIAVALIFMIFVSAESSIYSNAKSIELLRQIGAEDQWILSGFLRNFVLRCLLGSLLGVVIGILATGQLLSHVVDESGFFQTISIFSIQWPRALVIVFVSGLLAYLATYLATKRYLKKVR